MTMRRRGRGRSWLELVLVAAAAFAALSLPATASAVCSHMIGDPAPGYWGSAQGIFCEYEDGMPISWTAPPGITEAVFSARGADDAALGRGGRAKGTLPVTPGQTFSLEPGNGGGASIVSLDGVPLLVGAGANGAVANYVTPSASEVESQSAGAPITPAADGVTYVNDGEASVSWSTITKAPNPCVVPQLTGMRPVLARKKLATAYCAVGDVKRRPARRSAWGRITGQWPKAGSELPQGSSVNLRIGRRTRRLS
jgi:PASTA domain-containing protein